VTARAMIAKLQRFVGMQLIDCADEIAALATAGGYTVNINDPTFNTASIDEESKRLNVRTDVDYNITSFTIG
jgi:hypothetical protein